MVSADTPGAQGPACSAWGAWAQFVRQFLGSGARVIDPSSARAHSVSEAQAYALFFSLVANDPARFEQLLRWTEDNLAGGDLTMRLPAWLWGRRDDGSWGVIDENSAADADLWLAYTLGEAGRLWQQRRYIALSSVLAERILREETAPLPGLGRTLLPGPRGFTPEPGRWRLNPSYLPPFLLRWFAARSGDGRWQELLQTSLAVVRDSSPRGFAPDWAFYRSNADQGRTEAASGGHFEGPQLWSAERVGSYDAIRVYLWLGLTAELDPARTPLLEHFSPMADLLERETAPPESIDAIDGSAQGEGPAGFSAALLPFLAALGRASALRTQELRLRNHPVRPDAYYEQVLALFATGWRELRFAFAADGSLVPAWRQCPAPSH
jgi:endoglucanase